MFSATRKMNSNVRGLIHFRSFSRSCIRAKLKIPSADNLKLKLNKVEVPVEKDTKKLATHVCGTNLLVEGGEDVKLKPDSEYPDWLWKIGPPLPLEQLDRNTKAYWERVAQIRERELEIIKSLTRNSTVHK